MVHDRRNKDSHIDFLRYVLDKLEINENSRITCDREKSIVSAMKQVLEEKELSECLVYCENHILQNVECFIISLNNKFKQQNAENSFFYKKDVSELLQCADKNDLDKLIEKKEKKWHIAFIDYFNKFIYDDILNNVENKDGILKYSNNSPAESYNHQIKVFLNELNMAVDEFVLKLYEHQVFIATEMDLAYDNKRGKYQLKPELKGKKIKHFGLEYFKLDLEAIQQEKDEFQYSKHSPNIRNRSLIWLAGSAISMNLIGYDTTNHVYTVARPGDTNNVNTVKIIRNQMICSCGAGKTCFHLHAINFVLKKKVKIGNLDVNLGIVNRRRHPILKTAGKKVAEEREVHPTVRKLRSYNVKRKQARKKHVYISIKKPNLKKSKTLDEIERIINQQNNSEVISEDFKENSIEDDEEETTVDKSSFSTDHLKSSPNTQSQKSKTSKRTRKRRSKRTSILYSKNTKSIKKRNDEFDELVNLTEDTGLEECTENEISLIDIAKQLDSLPVKKRWYTSEIIDNYHYYLVENLKISDIFYIEPIIFNNLEIIYRKLIEEKESLNNYNFIICPVNKSKSHWILAIIFLKRNKIVILDSLIGKHNEYIDTLQSLKLIFFLFKFCINDPIELKELDGLECFLCEDCPQQTNSHECGPMVCFFMYRFMTLDLEKIFNFKFKLEVSNSLTYLEQLRNSFFYYKHSKLDSRKIEDHIGSYLEDNCRKRIKIDLGSIEYEHIFK